jgi:hypothetical protein
MRQQAMLGDRSEGCLGGLGGPQEKRPTAGCCQLQADIFRGLDREVCLCVVLFCVVCGALQSRHDTAGQILE